MLKHIGVGLIWAVVGYLIGAFGGGYLLSKFSTNMHDRGMEAAMTGAFFFGPVAGVLGFVAGLMRSLKERDADPRGPGG